MKRKAALIARRAIVGVLALAQVYVLMPVPQREAHVQYAFAASVTCPTQNGNYVAGGTLSATSNSYWQPGAGTLASGSTTITLGTQDTGGGGATTGVNTGDELLIMQMQDGTFNTSNSSSYGDGTGTGSGSTSIGNAGLYEYVSVSQAGVANKTTGSVGIQGIGGGGGLLNSYYENTASNQRYQIIRVPQYTTATLSGNFKAAYWDGKTGGVAALDMASTLNLGGASIYATGDGFRGGALAVASTTGSGVLNNDYTDSAQMNGAGNQPGFGTKGEGVNGSPAAAYYYTSFTTPSTPTTAAQSATPGANADGYAGGDQGMGAPGNAGGGGTDSDPQANDQNTGGGGGSNGGAGGKGGFPWTPQYSGNTSLYLTPGVHGASSSGATYSAFNSGDTGGRGGSSLSSYVGVDRVFMGGGGGSGANNNHSENPSGNTFGSAGGVGGGIILLRLADTSGSAATFYANGTTGQAPDNDGGGGGGAGGSVVITSPQAFSGITVNVNGTAGTTAAATGSDTTYAIQHGPGGGGGGGVVVTTSSVTVSDTGGAAGTTTTNTGGSSPVQPDNYGATAGSSGVVMNGTVTSAQVPGLGSGAQCYSSGTAGGMTLYTGPYDSGEATYLGSDETGSYDGVQTATDNNDFTARAIGFPTPSPQPSPVLIDNSATGSALNPVGNTFSVTSSPSNSIEHELYYLDPTQAGDYHPLTVTAVAPILPAQWSVQVCPDNGTNSPNCSYNTGSGTCANTADQNKWESNVSAAGSTNTMTFCYYSNGAHPKTAGTAQTAKYWTVYTGPTGTYTAFSRYDGYVDAKDDQATPAENKTHDELYAGFIPVGKTYSVVNANCKGTLQNPPANGVCPGGTVQYTLNYANIVAGANIGTEGQVTALFPISGAGTLKITDDGSANGSNWATYTNGLTETLSAGVSVANQASCGITAGHCGDTTAGTTCAYTGAGGAVTVGTKFVCTIGGAAFRLYPAGFTAQTSSGSLSFAAKVK